MFHIEYPSINDVDLQSFACHILLIGFILKKIRWITASKIIKSKCFIHPCLFRLYTFPPLTFFPVY